jgi:hypothetical protein
MADPSARSDDKGGGRGPAVHTLKLKDRGAGRKGLAKQDTDRFSAVVLTWNDPDAKAKGTPQVRARDLETGTWSAWQRLAYEPEPGRRRGGRADRAARRHRVDVDR